MCDDLPGWLAFLRGLLREHGDVLATLQVGAEASHDGPGGGFPQVRRAIVEGVLADSENPDVMFQFGLVALITPRTRVRTVPAADRRDRRVTRSGPRCGERGPVRRKGKA